jgi:hypothetical protein
MRGIARALNGQLQEHNPWADEDASETHRFYVRLRISPVLFEVYRL